MNDLAGKGKRKIQCSTKKIEKNIMLNFQYILNN